VANTEWISIPFDGGPRGGEKKSSLKERGEVTGNLGNKTTKSWLGGKR